MAFWNNDKHPILASGTPQGHFGCRAESREWVAKVDPSTGYLEALDAGKTVLTASDAFGFKASSLEIEVNKGVVKDEKTILAFSEISPSSVINGLLKKYCDWFTISP